MVTHRDVEVDVLTERDLFGQPELAALARMGGTQHVPEHWEQHQRAVEVQQLPERFSCRPPCADPGLVRLLVAARVSLQLQHGFSIGL